MSSSNSCGNDGSTSDGRGKRPAGERQRDDDVAGQFDVVLDGPERSLLHVVHLTTVVSNSTRGQLVSGIFPFSCGPAPEPGHTHTPCPPPAKTQTVLLDYWTGKFLEAFGQSGS